MKICGVIFVLLLAPPAQAQDDDVVRVKSNLVNIDVIVKDKKGKYISDLKANVWNGVQTFSSSEWTS